MPEPLVKGKSQGEAAKQAQITGLMNGFWYHPSEGECGQKQKQTPTREWSLIGYPGRDHLSNSELLLTSVTMILTLDNGPRYGQSQISYRLPRNGKEVYHPKVRENKMFVISFERNDFSCQCGNIKRLKCSPIWQQKGVPSKLCRSCQFPGGRSKLPLKNFGIPQAK